jgi:hypothetical protein
MKRGFCVFVAFDRLCLFVSESVDGIRALDT